MEKVCTNCGIKLTGTKTKYCSYECGKAIAKVQYLARNPDALKGKTCSTTGAISELRVAIDLMCKGYDVFRALSPASPCDLAILKDNQLLRVEVRTTFYSCAGSLTRNNNANGGNQDSVDVYAWVLPDKIVYEPELE